MRSRLSLLLLPLVAALAFAACSNEGEGQPCDTRAGNSGNDDCKSPLVCTTGLTNANSPRCCPQDRANATTPECALSSATFDGESPAPPDSSTEEASAEAAADTSAEAAADAAADAGTSVDASDGSAEAATD